MIVKSAEHGKHLVFMLFAQAQSIIRHGKHHLAITLVGMDMNYRIPLRIAVFEGV